MTTVRLRYRSGKSVRDSDGWLTFAFSDLGTVTIHPDGSYETTGDPKDLLLDREGINPETKKRITIDEDPFNWAKSAAVLFSGLRFHIHYEEIDED